MFRHGAHCSDASTIFGEWSSTVNVNHDRSLNVAESFMKQSTRSVSQRPVFIYRERERDRPLWALMWLGFPHHNAPRANRMSSIKLIHSRMSHTRDPRDITHHPSAMQLPHSGHSAFAAATHALSVYEAYSASCTKQKRCWVRHVIDWGAFHPAHFANVLGLCVDDVAIARNTIAFTEACNL